MNVVCLSLSNCGHERGAYRILSRNAIVCANFAGLEPTPNCFPITRAGSWQGTARILDLVLGIPFELRAGCLGCWLLTEQCYQPLVVVNCLLFLGGLLLELAWCRQCSCHVPGTTKHPPTWVIQQKYEVSWICLCTQSCLKKHANNCKIPTGGIDIVDARYGLMGTFDKRNVRMFVWNSMLFVSTGSEHSFWD